VKILTVFEVPPVPVGWGIATMPSPVKTLVALTLLCMASFAHAADSPPKPDEMDEFCEDVGRSKDPSISPKDRLRFGEACVCIDDVGCGVPGSPRFLARVEVARRALESLRLAEVERQAAQGKIQADLRVEALKNAQLACVDLADCFHRSTASPQSCDESESRFEYECSAHLRDSIACGKAMRAAAGTHGAAECQASLQK
jgi:hypothetical protein